MLNETWLKDLIVARELFHLDYSYGWRTPLDTLLNARNRLIDFWDYSLYLLIYGLKIYGFYFAGSHFLKQNYKKAASKFFLQVFKIRVGDPKLLFLFYNFQWVKQKTRFLKTCRETSIFFTLMFLKVNGGGSNNCVDWIYF